MQKYHMCWNFFAWYFGTTFSFLQWRERLDILASLEKLAKKDNSFWMRLLKDWSSKPWALVRAQPDRDPRNFSVKPEKSSKRVKDDFSLWRDEPEQKLEFHFPSLRLEDVPFPGIRHLEVLNSETSERLKLRPNFFQVRSKFFHFCFAIDTSSLSEVRTFSFLPRNCWSVFWPLS